MTPLQTVNATVVLIGIPAIVACLLSIGRKFEKIDRLEKAVEQLVEKVGRLEKAVAKINPLEKTVGKIKTNVKVIGDYLAKKDDDFSHQDLQNYSPLRLTPSGKKFIASLGFDKAFAENRADFFGYIDDEKPKQKYDVETAAIKSVILLSDKDYMGPLKKFLYNNPERSMRNTAPTLGVYIRDKYLEEHPYIAE